MDNIEIEARGRGARLIAGIDEVGRGPIAGPVIAAAVVFVDDHRPAGLADSKLLTARKRQSLADEILACAQVGLGGASAREIDRLNVLQATMLAMRRALSVVSARPDLVLIDGDRVPDGIDFPARSVVRGDAQSRSIAAASIVAKVTRDRIMARLDGRYPGFGWSSNSGYPTRQHLTRLHLVGPTAHHRRSFGPVRKLHEMPSLRLDTPSLEGREFLARVSRFGGFRSGT